jgi:hypothetical protein
MPASRRRFISSRQACAPRDLPLALAIGFNNMKPRDVRPCCPNMCPMFVPASFLGTMLIAISEGAG